MTDEGCWMHCTYGEYGATFIAAYGTELDALRAMNIGPNSYMDGWVMWVNWGEELRTADDRRTGRG